MTRRAQTTPGTTSGSFATEQRTEASVEPLIESASTPAWTETFPADSPAADVAAFKGKPSNVWFGDSNGPGASFIAADGSYVGVEPDNEPTDHWFVDGVWADGSMFDECLDSREAAMRVGENILTGGKTSHEAGRTSW